MTFGSLGNRYMEPTNLNLLLSSMVAPLASIAEEFMKSFKSNSEPNNRQKVDELNNRFDKEYDEFNQTHDTH